MALYKIMRRYCFIAKEYFLVAQIGTQINW